MKITFLIGNGFDLNQDLKTGYADFREHYTQETEKDSLCVKAFKEKLEKYDCWSDLEMALGNMLCEYDETNVDDFITGLEDLKKKLSLYLSSEEKKFKYKLHKIKKELKRTLGIFYTKHGYLYPFHDLDIERPTTNVVNFISFNYTRIINNMMHKMRKKHLSFSWKNTENKIGEVLSVHGTTKIGFVLGVNDASQINHSTLCSDPRIQMHLIKKNQIDIMNRYSRAKKADKIINDSDIIYVYGMSLGETDNMYWKTVCNWLNEDKKHLLIVNRFDRHFNPIDMGTIAEKTAAFADRLKSLGANDIAIEDQVYYITNATIFNFVKKTNRKT